MKLSDLETNVVSEIKNNAELRAMLRDEAECVFGVLKGIEGATGIDAENVMIGLCSNAWLGVARFKPGKAIATRNWERIVCGILSTYDTTKMTGEEIVVGILAWLCRQKAVSLSLDHEAIQTTQACESNETESVIELTDALPAQEYKERGYKLDQSRPLLEQPLCILFGEAPHENEKTCSVCFAEPCPFIMNER